MLKILLADDDNLILNQLNEIFSKLSDKAVVAGQAMNGRQAVELALKLKPDLVIMDVEMPVINGIAAASEILSRLPETRVLALSNYDSFHYLRDMMKAGAMDYLLKHELSVSDVRRRLEKLEQRRKEAEQSQREEKLLSLIARQTFLGSLCLGGEPDPDYLEVMLSQRDFSGERFGVATLWVTNFGALYQKGQPERLIQSVLNVCSTLFSTLQNGVIAPVSPDAAGSAGSFVLLFNFEKEVSQQKMEGTLSNYLSLVRGNLKRLLNLDTVMAKGFLFGRLTGLAERYRQLDEELHHLPFRSAGEQDAWRLDILDERALIDAMDQQDLSQLEQVLERVFSGVLQLDNPFKSAQLAAEELLSLLERYLRRQNLADGQQLLDRLRSRLPTVSPQSLYEELRGLFATALGSQADPRFSSYSPHTQRVILFMRRRYGENIALTDAAEEAGLSAAYLSRIFKEDTGCNFIDYLTQLRLFRAQALLRESDLSVREVGSRVGFGSSSYFIRVFRRQMGVTPTQYQQDQRKNQGGPHAL